MYDEFEGRTVIDLGCGTVQFHAHPLFFAASCRMCLKLFRAPHLGWCVQGMLSIGAALLGSAHCLGLDIDADALETAQANLSTFQDLPVASLEDYPKAAAISGFCISIVSTSQSGQYLTVCSSSSRENFKVINFYVG